MADKLPFMPWYGFDYEADERCKLLTDAEDGVYRKLLWEQWKEGSVPADPAVAARLIRSDNPDLVPDILAMFFKQNGSTGRLYNERLHVIRRQIEAERAGKRRGGKKGRRKQLETQPEVSPSSARAEAGQPEPEPEPEPETDATTAPVEPSLDGSESPGTSVTNARQTRPRRHDEIRDHLAGVLAEIEDGTRQRIQVDEIRTLQAELVFAYWQAKLHHQGALLDDRRLNRLKARLRENQGNVHELLFVVDGTLRDDHLMGRKGEGRKYDGIETIYRDRAQVERLSEIGGYRPGKLHAMAEKYLKGVEP